MKNWAQHLLAVIVVVTAHPAGAAMIGIGAMTTPNVVIDFGLFPTGPTSVALINTAVPGANIVSLTFVEESGSGVYDTDLGSGNALAADGAGGLQIVPELGGYANATSLTIVLDRFVTQFGFQLADRAASTLEFFAGAALVGSTGSAAPTTPPVTNFFESDVAFDTIRISQDVNWVIPELVLQTARSIVPVPASAALLVLGLLGFTMRRKA